MDSNELYKRLLFIPVVIFIVWMLIGLGGVFRMFPHVEEDNTPAIFGPIYTAPLSIDSGITVLCDEDVKKESNLLDLNSAAAEELETLPGIGKVRAEEIVKQREKMAGFRSLEDVLCTKGIGLSVFEGFKNLVTVYEYKP